MPPTVPTFDQLMNPLLRALRALGGSGSIEEIYDKVVELEGFSEDLLSQLHDPEKSNQTEVGYRLAWARSWLKKYGLLDNSARGVWSLTVTGKETEQVDPQTVVRGVRSQYRRAVPEEGALPEENEVAAPASEAEEPTWKERLHLVLTQKLTPDGFERLVQRLLRESGFIQVEVTGRSGDGGIDGRGIARIHGFMSFHVFFQCKRYRGSVSAGEVRDFRGAMVGRADRGLFLTTGTFSPAAVKEATRDGAPPIDLIDGSDLAEKLRELGLGIRKELVEVITVDDEWFQGI
jgi:restriction system protein